MVSLQVIKGQQGQYDVIKSNMAAAITRARHHMSTKVMTSSKVHQGHSKYILSALVEVNCVLSIREDGHRFFWAEPAERM